MPDDRKLKKIGEAYKESCSYTPHSDSGDSVQESERLINSAYENTLNLGHPTPPADLNRRELRSGRSYHIIPSYQASLRRELRSSRSYHIIPLTKLHHPHKPA